MSNDHRGFGAAVWASGFRPFFLFGTLYGVVLMLAWAASLSGVGAAPSHGMASLAWHGREMIFGFAVAIIAGVVLTALPSWPGTAEIHGGRLAWLFALWLAGRAGAVAAPWLPAGWPMAADAVFLPALFAMVGWQLLRVDDRRYLLILPVIAAMFAAQMAAHASHWPEAPQSVVASLHVAVYAVIVLYVLVGGLLTPVFTGNALRDSGRGDQARFVPALEIAAVASIVVLAALDLGGAPAGWVALAAITCTVVHGVRVARWKGWRAANVPIALAMNLGFAWLVATFALHAASALLDSVPATAWVHAFTVGSLGMMMLGLMTRVVLRHTGRPLRVPRSMLVAGAAMFAAALLRLAASVHRLDDTVVAFAALLWAAAFGLWLMNFAGMLVAPSLPRKSPPADARHSGQPGRVRHLP